VLTVIYRCKEIKSLYRHWTTVQLKIISLEPIKGHCPKCNDLRNSEIVGYYAVSDSDENIWATTNYRILKCMGCEAVFFQEEFLFSENIGERRDPSSGIYDQYIVPEISYWPAPSKRAVPEWFENPSNIDSDLHSLLKEVYTALNNDLRVLAAIGLRTAFDKSSELLGIDQGRNFAEKLSDLEINKLIGQKEKDILNVLTDAGNAAAHRGWKPTLTELKTMMDIFETFLYRTFILDTAAQNLKPSIPKRKK